VVVDGLKVFFSLLQDSEKVDCSGGVQLSALKAREAGCRGGGCTGGWLRTAPWVVEVLLLSGFLLLFNPG